MINIFFLYLFAVSMGILEVCCNSNMTRILSSVTTSGEILQTVALEWVSTDDLPYFGLHVRTLNLCNRKKKIQSIIF